MVFVSKVFFCNKPSFDKAFSNADGFENVGFDMVSLAQLNNDRVAETTKNNANTIVFSTHQNALDFTTQTTHLIRITLYH